MSTLWLLLPVATAAGPYAWHALGGEGPDVLSWALSVAIATVVGVTLAVLG